MTAPWSRALPLRVSLVAAMLVLVGFGLLVSGLGVTSVLRHSLLSRVDERLIDASTGWAQQPRQALPDQQPNPSRPPSNFYVQGVDARGDVWMAINDRKAQPSLPDSNDVGPVPVTIGSVGDTGVRWRAVSVRSPGGELITVAVDLSDVQSTVRSLVLLQAGIGTAVLLVLGVAGYWVVHRSLQPLIEVEKTAAAIAAGQLESRVPQGVPGTEVGQLSQALNGSSRRSSGQSHLRRLRPNKRECPKTECAGSSWMPATSYGHR